MHKKIVLMLFILIPSILVACMHAHPVTATATTLYIDPSTTTVTGTGETFSVNITIFNVTDLTGWDFKLLYSSTILNGTSVTEGPFLNSTGSTFFLVAAFTDEYNATHGILRVLCALTGLGPGVNGSGVLATVTFKTKSCGDTILHLFDTIPIDSQENTIPHTPVDGTVHVIPPDVAITNITLSKNTVLQGETVKINATAKNEGGRTETFTVTAYYDGNAIETQNVINLAPAASTTLTFPWDTTGVPLGEYTVKAEASIIPGETDTADNTYVDGTVKITKSPTASFTYAPPSPTADETVTFNASASTPNGGTITSYKWNFGDLNTTDVTNPVITHVYTSDGTYNVTLTITDSEGLTDSTWQQIEVTIHTNHDIAITNITPYTNAAYPGWTVKINVTAENQGDYTETFNVTAYYNTDIIETKTITNLTPTTQKTLTFNWNTTEIAYCQNYTIKAQADTLPSETDTADNTLTDGTIKIKIPGDTNGDNKVDWQDLFVFAGSYGSLQGEPAYVSEADFNSDGKINWQDLFTLSRNYGTIC